MRKILLAFSAVIFSMAIAVFLTSYWLSAYYSVEIPEKTASFLLDFPGEQISLPMKMKYGWPVVEVKINEQGPFSLILDTGCSSLTLSPEVIAQLQLPEIGSSTSINAAGQSHVSKTYGVETVQLGPASLQRIEAGGTDFFKQSYPEIDGLFGQRNFGNLMMTMDFQGETLTLRKSLSAKNQDPEWVPITIKQGNPELSLKIRSHEIPFLVDTGSLGSLNVGESQVANLPLHENRYQDLETAFGGLPLRTQTTRMTNELLLGKQKLVQPYVSWYEGAQGRNLIGMKILRHFTLELDLKNKQARFVRSATTPVSFANQKRLGFSLAYYQGDDVFQVVNVRPDQGEGQTLRVGDRVISIDGVEMHQIDEQTLRKFRETRDQLTLVVERLGARLSIEHPVQEDTFPAPAQIREGE